jgi:type II secretory pathway component HofQ
VFRFLEDISQRKHEIDACVQGAVTLRLQNVPLALVYDVLASKLALTYDDSGDAIKVRCGPAAGAASQREQTIELDLRDADVRALFDVIARFTRRRHVLDSCVQGVVSIRLKHVPVEVAYEALARKIGLTYVHESDVTRVSCR